MKILLSRFVGFVLVAMVVYSVVSIARRSLPRSSAPMRDAGFVEVKAPDLEKAEAIVRDHIIELQKRCAAIAASPVSTPFQRGRGFGELGKVYLTYQFPGAAAACFRNAAMLEPDQFRWPYYLANALRQAGKNAEAAAPMAHALRLMANDVVAEGADEHAALCMLGDLAIRLNKPAEARETLALALKVNPNSVFVLVKLGQLASHAGDTGEAIDDFEKALAVAPNHVAIRVLLAAEYRRRGDQARAAALAVPNDSNRHEAPLAYPDPLMAELREQDRSGSRQNRIGANLLDIGRYREALAHFNTGVRAAPQNATLRYNQGFALLALGHVEEAQKSLEEALRLNPGSDVFRAMLDNALARSPGTRKRALDDATAWRKEQPGNEVALRTLAGIDARLCRYQDALANYAELEKLKPTHPLARLGQARMLAALGKGREARRVLETAAELFADDSEVNSNLARLLVTCPDDTIRDGAKSLRIIQRLIASEYTVTRAETLALALAETGQYDKALEVQRKAVAQCGEEGDIAVRKRLQGVLHTLEQKQPWRELWPFQELNADVATVVRK